MKPVGIFGGTFDPVHNGHLITAQSLIEIRDLQKIIFIPASFSPHKTDKVSSSPDDRLHMLKAAVEGVKYFEVSDIEIAAGGISYTIETLRVLKEKYDKLELIIGYDNLPKFSSWKDPEGILELAKLIVLKRHNETKQVNDKFSDKAVFVETPLIEISATDIRRRVMASLPVNFLVPEKVKEYIYTFNLYKQER